MPNQRTRVSYSAPSLVAPAVRMVVLAAYAEEDHPEVTTTEVYPVVALRSYIREESRYSRDDRVLLDSFDYGPEVDILICPFDLGVETVEDSLGPMVRTAYRVVACPWDRSEDGARFRPFLDELRQEATRNARRQARERQAAPTVPMPANVRKVAQP